MATWSYFQIKDFFTQAAKKVLAAVVNTDQYIPAHVLVDADGNERSVLKVKPGSAAATVLVSVQTNATGTSYSAFPSQACSSLTIANGSVDATPLQVRNVASPSTTLQIPINGVVTLLCAANANEWELRRVDTLNTQITIVGLAN